MPPVTQVESDIMSLPQAATPSWQGWHASMVPLSLQPYAHAMAAPHCPSLPQVCTAVVPEHWLVPGVHAAQASFTHAPLGQFVAMPQCPLLLQV